MYIDFTNMLTMCRLRAPRLETIWLLVDLLLPGNSDAINSHSAQRLCLNEMEIDGRVDLRGYSGNSVDLRNSNIRLGLILQDTHVDSKWEPDWGEAELLLDNARIGALSLGRNVPLPRYTRVSGTSIGHLRVVTTAQSGMRSLMNAQASAKLVKSWIDKFPFELAGREAYHVFQEVYSSSGEKEAVRTLRLAEEQRVTKEMKDRSIRYWWRQFVNVLSGYGYAPENTMICALFLVGFGAIVFYKSEEGMDFLLAYESHEPKMSVQTNRRKFLRFSYRICDSIVFSLDRMIPILEIRETHKYIGFNAERCIRIYFVGHTILGWILSATLLGVIAKTFGLSFE